jgi:hypothetical protein
MSERHLLRCKEALSKMSYIFRRAIDARLIIKEADRRGTFWKLLRGIAFLYPRFFLARDKTPGSDCDTNGIVTGNFAS